VARPVRRKRRWPRIAAVAMVLSAVVSWMIFLDEGPSTARLIAGVATSVGSILSLVRLWKEERGGTQREV